MGLPFRRPLGLAVSGAGSLGAWEAGLISGLIRAGLEFDQAWGFSAGSLNAAAYFLRRSEEASELWTHLERRRVLVPSVRYWPGAIFSDRPLRRILESWGPADPDFKKRARCVLHVVTLNLEDAKPRTATFDPKGRWDAPLIENLVASCSVPIIFPPVRMVIDGTVRTLIDGGVPGQELVDFKPLQGCKDILSLSIANPAELGRFCWGPIDYINRQNKRLIHKQMESGAKSLESLAERPRVFKLVPSKPLDYNFLNFSASRCRAAHEQGARDAESFLSNPVPAP